MRHTFTAIAISALLVAGASPAVAAEHPSCGVDPSTGTLIVDLATGLPLACGVTILRADQAGLARVVIPVDVEFRNDWDMFSGAFGTWVIRTDDQHLAGFVLQREDPDPFTAYATTAWRFPADFRDGERFAHERQNANLPVDGTLPAGTYRIQLVTEPEVPAEVELHFGGLEGRLELSPEVVPLTPVSTIVRRLPQQAQSPDDETHFQSSGSGVIEPGSLALGGGFGFAYVAVRGWPQVSQSNACLYQGGPRSPELNSIPFCVPRGGNDGSLGPVLGATYLATEESEEWNRMGIFSSLDPGPHTFVASAQSLGEAHTVAALAVWISTG